MEQGWRERLLQEVQKTGKSQRSLSMKAGLGPGYLNSILGKAQKDPTVTSLLKVTEVLGVSISYICYAIEMTYETEQLLRGFVRLNPRQRSAFRESVDAMLENDRLK